MSKIRVGMIVPKADDGTSYYRGWGPWLYLQKHYPVELVELNDISWKSLMTIDAVFMQRPFGSGILQTAQRVLQMGIPIWADWDDHLLAVKQDNPAYNQYQDPVAVSAYRQFVSVCSVVSVSTQYLAQVLEEYTVHDPVVIPNAADMGWWDRLVMPQRQRQGSEVTHVFWRGAVNHAGNIMSFADDIVELAQTKEDTTWSFMGNFPWFIQNRMPAERSRGLGWKNIPGCFSAMTAACPDVLIVPLEDTPFDRSRSNVAWLEATLAGAVVVAPAWPEWKHAGVINYSHHSPPPFIDAVTAAINLSTEDRHKMNNEARTEIQENLSLEKVSASRYEVLQKLVSGSVEIHLEGI